MSDRRIEIVIEINDDVWAQLMKGDEDYTPTEADILEHFVEYAEGAYIDDGVTYSGRLV